MNLRGFLGQVNRKPFSEVTSGCFQEEEDHLDLVKKGRGEQLGSYDIIIYGKKFI